MARLAGEAEILDEAGGVHLTVPVTAPVPWKVWLADEPPRLIVDFQGLAFDEPPVLRSGSIADLRLERAEGDWTRLVAYLREPLTVIEAEMHGTETGAQLDLVLGTTTGGAFKEEARALTEPVAETEKTCCVVVLDPGHGGRDPGAEAGAVNEATLMLEFSLLLKEVLEETGQFEVHLTRSKDVFVPLDARMSLARAANADVFLSLHADDLAKGSGAASGLTLYTLAADAVPGARSVARGAGDDILKEVDLETAEDQVALALAGLQGQTTAPRTAALSRNLLGAVQASDIAVNSRPERQAEFAVLKAADIPSVLVELGFLSSKEDLARLTSPEWHRQAADALRDGLLLWAEEDRLLREGLGN
ncbi:MAG: N-acetylmuramoyl-L-alanine amidase [Silicimonas sp.]|nr:N-acetylmuramoyl-L-alanine amidase [Silicimonas sp.]